MKVVDAIWEKRNLGVSCSELHIEWNDCIQEVEKIYSGVQERQYMVVRVPSEKFDLLQFFQRKGYLFMEAAITLEHNLKDVMIPKRLMRICDKCTWQRMDESDLQQLSEEIYKNIFRTDRIYRDEVFTKYQAAQRYDFWIKDLVQKGQIPFKVLYEGEAVGFFLNTELRKGVYDGLLAATYSGFEGSGMGYCIQYAGIKSVMNRGAHKYIGHVSANNLMVLKVLLSIGFSIKSIEYILIKHCKGE